MNKNTFGCMLLALLIVLTTGTGCPGRGPQADFEADVVSGDAPLFVQFTDLTTPGRSPITAWLWSFGDGAESSEQDPFHLYQDAGTYTVSLTVTTADGEDTASSFITATQTIMLPGDVPLTMVECPGGTFTMGRHPNEQDGLGGDTPRHDVTVPTFWIAQTELTKEQWETVMGTTPWDGREYVIDDPDSPAVYMSWNDAHDLITMLGLFTGFAFTLPTEAQWEYACRAGTTTRYYFGNDMFYTLIDDYAWYNENATFADEDHAHIVGQKIPNAWNLYDMSGNVWEWCEDDYHSDYTGAPTDGSAWVDAPRAEQRILRGGSYYTYPQSCLSAGRNYNVPTNNDADRGIRLVLIED